MNRFILLSGMILVAVLSKFLPHPVNFAPIGAIALFGGANFTNKRAAYFVPLMALLIGDLITGLHVLIPFVYGCFALNVLLGFWIKRQQSVPRVAFATLLGAIVFFLVTNLGSWLAYDTFQKTTAGLIACYAAGLPYFVNSLLGDFFYCAVLFGGLAFAEAKFPTVRRAEVAL
ncbi:MAG TPA: DUF6580 family putative transport protein [Verrucomicrobiae bacterium]